MALLRLHGDVQGLGECPIGWVEPPQVVRLQVGDSFDLHVYGDMTVKDNSKLRRVTVKRDNDSESTLTYKAVESGETDLVGENVQCTSRLTHRQKFGRCALVHFVITSA